MKILMPPIPPDVELKLGIWLEELMRRLREGVTENSIKLEGTTQKAKITAVNASTLTAKLLNTDGSTQTNTITVNAIKLGSNSLTGDVWPDYQVNHFITVYKDTSGTWQLTNPYDDTKTFIDHGADLQGLSDDDHTQYLLANGTRGLSASWDAGSFGITAETFTSDVTTGTQPYACTSQTLNTNLNADLWDGYQFSDYLDQAVKQASSPTFASLLIGSIKSGATQVAAGAAANEIWKTSGHATLPDNVLMIGV